MGRRIVGWLVLVPLCLVILAFALANRHPVIVNFNPLVGVDPSGTGSMPLFLPLFAALFIGVALGGAAVWLTQGGHRRAERRYRRDAEALRDELRQIRGRRNEDADPDLLAADELP